MTVADELSESDFDFSTDSISFFNDPDGKLKTEYKGLSVDKSKIYVVTNKSARVLTDSNGSADVYQGDIPRLFVLLNDDQQKLRRVVDIDGASYIVKTKHSEFHRRMTHSDLNSKWIVSDVCNTTIAVLLADMKLENNRISTFYYPQFVFYDDKASTFSSGGVSLTIRNKGTNYKLEFERLGITVHGHLNLEKQNNLVISKDGVIKNLDLDKVFSWEVHGR